MAEINKAIKVNNIYTNIIDNITGKSVNYIETLVWHDGSIMDDTKVDGVIYRKKDNNYYVISDYKNGYILDVRLFGVSPDNIDNTNYLQKAIDIASSYKIGTIYIPAGVYKFNNSVYIRSRISIEGINPIRTILTSDNDIAIFTWFKHVEYVSIKNICFTNNQIGNGKGISNPYFLQSENEGSLPYMSKSIIDNCHFRTNLKECIEGNILHTTIKNCYFGYDGNQGLTHRHLNLQGDLSYAIMNFNKVENCMFTRAKGRESCYLSKGVSFEFKDCDWEYNQTDYTIYNEGVGNLKLNHCWWETHGRINNDTVNPNSTYLIYLANSPVQAGASNVTNAVGFVIENSDIHLENHQLGLIRIAAGHAATISIINNRGVNFDNKNISYESPTTINIYITSYFGNVFYIAGSLKYSTVSNTISGLLPAKPQVSTKGFSQSAWFVGWNTSSTQGWTKGGTINWAQTTDAGFFGNTIRLTMGNSPNFIYMSLPIEYFKGKTIAIRTIGKRISGASALDLKIAYRLNLQVPTNLSPIGSTIGTSITELYNTIDVPSDATYLNVGLYMGGGDMNSVYDIYAFDVWVINNNVIPLFSFN